MKDVLERHPMKSARALDALGLQEDDGNTNGDNVRDSDRDKDRDRDSDIDSEFEYPSTYLVSYSQSQLKKRINFIQVNLL